MTAKQALCHESNLVTVQVEEFVSTKDAWCKIGEYQLVHPVWISDSTIQCPLNREACGFLVSQKLQLSVTYDNKNFLIPEGYLEFEYYTQPVLLTVHPNLVPEGVR